MLPCDRNAFSNSVPSACQVLKVSTNLNFTAWEGRSRFAAPRWVGKPCELTIGTGRKCPSGASCIEMSVWDGFPSRFAGTVRLSLGAGELRSEGLAEVGGIVTMGVGRLIMACSHPEYRDEVPQAGNQTNGRTHALRKNLGRPCGAGRAGAAYLDLY